MDLYSIKLEQIKKDPDQHAAFKSNMSTVVKAGPGSGKTTVLSLKIMHLLKEKIKEPRGLACITYSNEAAKEFTNRLKTFGYQKRQNVVLDTVHSFCISEVIVPFAHLYDTAVCLPLNIISKSDKAQLFKEILEDRGIDRRSVKVEAMDKERNQQIGGISFIETEPNDIAREVATEYEHRLRERNQVDFIEIIKCATTLIKEQEYVRKCLEAKFPWILIDEYQDLGKPLHEMVLTLFHKTNIKIFAVGDPDQSIYGFQGAIPDYLLELYDTPNIMSIDLKTNYRSNQDIIDAATVALNLDDREYKAGTRAGEKADFHFISCDAEMDEQYKYVVNNIIPDCVNKNIPLEEICILVGSGDQVKALSSVMNEVNIPHYLAKHEFLKSKIILWLKDCASWVLDNSSVAFTDIVEFWINILSKLNGELSDDSKLHERKYFLSLLRQSVHFQHSLNLWLSYLLDNLNLEQIVSDSQRFTTEKEQLSSFQLQTTEGELSDYDLLRFSQVGKPENQVTISTRHSSKGLEFEVVIMLGMEEGNFPFYSTVNIPKELNEQRRIFFVCITRAKRVCYLLRSKQMTSKTKYGLRTFSKNPSMFWEELYAVLESKRSIY
ncbi:DNA helicase [Cytobacillus firmus]|nr:ATP-dependent helicase [Cytobacillus firmus]MBG9543234.1 DNA helicase [Cytobacillus firmus]MBG9552664.1 DNA helicase [Cytobacillus firmus]MBG9559444.1 DNA helicase [Cytobacillus firmus]MBG9576183.1 DNA helicase [Cytobacillus firmus]MEC1894543.1 ATP-dependent helicase [Cytobacillus firmus]